MGSSSRVVQIKGPFGIVVKRHFHFGYKEKTRPKLECKRIF